MGARLTCPDGGTCHHECASRCWRVLTCEPLTEFGEEWPAEVKALHRMPEPTPPAVLELWVGETRIRYEQDEDRWRWYRRIWHAHHWGTRLELEAKGTDVLWDFASTILGMVDS